MYRQLTAIVLVALSIGATAQTTQVFNANKVNEYALVYTLPETAFEVTLKAEKTMKKPGEFAIYAKKYLGMDPILKSSVDWRLLDAEIIPTAVVDPEERYQVQFKSGGNVTMTLTADGFPLAINDEEAFAPEVRKSGLTGEAAAATILERPVAKQAVTEDMLRSTSSAKRAELAAARIFEIRQSRADLIAGDADNMPKDGDALKVALQQLADQEEALTAMFVGTTSVSTEVRTYNAEVPEADGRYVVARLSSSQGLLEADDLAGNPVYLTVSNSVRAELPVNEKGEEKTFPKGGVAYRIPGSARIAVSFDGRTFATLDSRIAQYGVVFGIDPGLFSDKKSPATAIFDPLTGALLQIK